jgi:hypothetical protein
MHIFQLHTNLMYTFSVGFGYPIQCHELKNSLFMVFNPYDVAVNRKETSIKGTYWSKKF